MFRIALLGDLHYPSNDVKKSDLQETADNFFTKYLHEFLSIDADLHVSIGDLTHLGLESEFQFMYDLVRKYDVIFRQVLGNHDVLSLSKEKITELIGQPRYDAIETEECLLLFLDTTKELQLHGWGLDKEQWNWLEAQMSRSIEKPLMIFAHHPVPNTTKYSPEGNTSFEALQDIRPLLAKREGLVIYFNGHTHSQSIIQQANHHFVQTGAVLCDSNYLVIELNDDQINIHTMNIGDVQINAFRKTLYEKLSDFHRPNLLADGDASSTYRIIRSLKIT
ncbi:metallophosphoesterase family protein [Lederbergia citrea]|uniref:Metallophosphoesterase n=1 Tax=Lederbergia citrea TaxID=2833581 RepID=A0A942UMQ1_9BACI|nr:metallophosphoesterase [Lederbergia citrea]MBS4224271.1 metallophosphoesterase [Lederbergia citrea]